MDPCIVLKISRLRQWEEFRQKRFYARGRIRGKRVSQLTKISTFFMIGGDN